MSELGTNECQKTKNSLGSTPERNRARQPAKEPDLRAALLLSVQTHLLSQVTLIIKVKGLRSKQGMQRRTKKKQKTNQKSKKKFSILGIEPLTFWRT